MIFSFRQVLYNSASKFPVSLKYHADQACSGPVLRQGVLLIPSLYIMHALFGYIGIAFSHTVVDISAALIGLILFLRQYRKFMAS